jgi:hypothetical protein
MSIVIVNIYLKLFNYIIYHLIMNFRHIDKLFASEYWRKTDSITSRAKSLLVRTVH